jgi:predicted ATP-grasp superfamily ATP-dependent carboligase
MERIPRHFPPAILLGGSCNALSVARSLGRMGVKVYVFNTTEAYVCQSRWCTPLRVAGDDVNAWGAYLLSKASDRFRGAVLLACSDAELEYVALHRPELAAKYRLDLSDPAAQLVVLNKLQTYEKAQAAGVPLPRWWAPQSVEDVERARGGLSFPLVVKPLYSHVYRKRFTQKLVVARDFAHLVEAVGNACAANVGVMLVEMIPGPDDRLCSYYTYLDETGTPLFHFTKRVIRRYPPLMGGGCYHITDWNPKVAELALQFFHGVGVRGLANAEFKYDERDGRLKLIECNARFTEANCLVASSGYNLARFVYRRLVGLPLEPFGSYKRGMRLWYPVEDFRAFRQLRREGTLTLWGWLTGLLHKQTLPFFSWDDPRPTLKAEWRRVKTALGRRFGRP